MNRSIAEIIDDPQYIAWEFRLPEHVDQERIVINESLAKATGKMAGFGNIVVGEYSGAPLMDGVDIMGTNDDGTALAAATQSATRDKGHKALITPGNDRLLSPDFRRPTATLQCNRTALADQVIALQDRTANDTSSWATVLNGAYQQGIRRATRQHLIPSPRTRESIFGYSYVFCEGLAATPPYDGIRTPLLASVVATMYGISLVQSLQNNKNRTGSYHFGKKRWSLFPQNFQPERALGAAITSALPTISYRK